MKKDLTGDTFVIDREMAEEIQKHMDSNNTIFTDLMDEHHIDSLVFQNYINSYLTNPKPYDTIQSSKARAE